MVYDAIRVSTIGCSYTVNSQLLNLLEGSVGYKKDEVLPYSCFICLIFNRKDSHITRFETAFLHSTGVNQNDE